MKTSIPGWLVSNMYCIILLTLISLKESKSRMINVAGIKTFRWFVIFLIGLVVADSTSRLFAYQEFNYMMFTIKLAMYLKYIMTPLAGPIFYRYFIIQAFGVKGLKRKSYYAIWMIWVVITGMVLAGGAFYFDANDVYYRGQYYLLPVSLMILIVVIIETDILLSKSYLNEKDFGIYATVLIPPVLGALLQMSFYGYSFSLMGGCISIISLYINIVSVDVNVDYLTGLYSRRSIDLEIDRRIRSDFEEPFGVLLINISNFKTINEEYGYHVGDDVLLTIADQLTKNCNTDDCVSRYSGDEFLVFLNNCDQTRMMQYKSQLLIDIKEYNEKNDRGILLEYYEGSMVYDLTTNLSFDEFMQQITRKLEKQHKRILMNKSVL